VSHHHDRIEGAAGRHRHRGRAVEISSSVRPALMPF
jgi:hypothetical protein